MKFQKMITKNKGRMSKREKQQFLEMLNRELLMSSHQHQRKYKFVEDFVKSLHCLYNEDAENIQLGPVDKRIFIFFLFLLLEKWDHGIQ